LEQNTSQKTERTPLESIDERDQGIVAKDGGFSPFDYKLEKVDDFIEQMLAWGGRFLLRQAEYGSDRL
jgi:hypothetical protein